MSSSDDFLISPRIKAFSPRDPTPKAKDAPSPTVFDEQEFDQETASDDEEYHEPGIAVIGGSRFEYLFALDHCVKEGTLQRVK